MSANALKDFRDAYHDRLSQKQEQETPFQTSQGLPRRSQ
jgi:hypothetical protein